MICKEVASWASARLGWCWRGWCVSISTRPPRKSRTLPLARAGTSDRFRACAVSDCSSAFKCEKVPLRAHRNACASRAQRRAVHVACFVRAFACCVATPRVRRPTAGPASFLAPPCAPPSPGQHSSQHQPLRRLAQEGKSRRRALPCLYRCFWLRALSYTSSRIPASRARLL